MLRLPAIFIALIFLTYQAKSQNIKSPLNILGLPLTETIDARNYIDVPRTYFNGPSAYLDAPRSYIDGPRSYIDIPVEALRNYANLPRVVEASNFLPQPISPAVNKVIPVNVPNTPCVPSTTVISDCNPSVCRYLTDTINLLVVSNLLQNTLGEKAMQLAAPLPKDVITQSFIGGPPISFANANTGPLVAPNFVVPNLAAPNIVAPNYIPQNLIAPNLVASSAYSATPIAPSNAIAPINNGAYLSSLLNILNGGAF